MAIGNTITVVGNLTRDPELRFTASGVARALLGIAVNRRWQNRQTGEWEEDTSFFNIVCWREMAENVATSLSQGSRVIVTGRLDQRSWETDQGERRSTIEIVADDIGPSLRWATAEVEKTGRRSAEPVGAGTAGGPSGGGGGTTGGDSGWNDGEEPF